MLSIQHSTFFYRCAGCHQIVSKSDLVFRVRSRAFHLDCFRCAVCDRLLQPGEEIAFQNEQVCCLNHAQLSSQRSCLDMGTKSTWMPKLIGLSGSIEDQLDRGLFKQKSASSTDGSSQNVKVLNPGGLLPSLLNTRSDTIKASDPVEFDESGTYDDLCLTASATGTIDSTTGVGARTGGTILTELVSTDFTDTYCSSPQIRPNSSGSSLGVALRDTDSPMTESSETSSLLGLGTSTAGAGISEAGHGSVGQSSLMPLVFGGSGTPGPSAQNNSVAPNGTSSGSNSGATNVTTNGSMTIGQLDTGSQAGSGSSSSGTSALGCGDEVVHSIVVSRTGSRPGKSGGSKRSKDHKATRVRTVLNEKQLHTLRTCYAANPRPDALMKEQLVEMTSLSPRVIRVWFQNKRCKDKKRQLLLKQMEQHQQVSKKIHRRVGSFRQRLSTAKHGTVY
ncbi:unnamed protein product [Echinostoma caproni]|uniref:Homeobox domain-containing protein n=1 Tax=Echinostoma caproni TaxID=27848 RepID=A0A183AZW8_9TREM|nr:unnamed protein product [Echinostoma caproni]